MSETVTITKAKLEEYTRNEYFLHLLRVHGVDNCEAYQEARRDYNTAYNIDDDVDWDYEYNG